MTLLDTIRLRRTTKVLAPADAPLPVPDGSERTLLSTMLEAGQEAPHHFPCHDCHRPEEDGALEPWRFYVLDGAACRALRSEIEGWDGKVETTMRLLGGTDGLIIVTWLPDPAEGTLPDGAAFAPTRRNMEHIAAASSAIQNMLLVATEAGRETFWASGGPILLSSAARAKVGIPTAEVVLGTIYLAPESAGVADVKPGSRRDVRGAAEACTRWVSFEA
ncbi:MAG: nitroreductase family protein [Gemmatimonadota bacterium]